jgi:uncharacterized membrane protein
MRIEKLINDLIAIFIVIILGASFANALSQTNPSLAITYNIAIFLIVLAIVLKFLKGK